MARPPRWPLLPAHPLRAGGCSLGLACLVADGLPRRSSLQRPKDQALQRLQQMCRRLRPPLQVAEQLRRQQELLVGAGRGCPIPRAAPQPLCRLLEHVWVEPSLTHCALVAHGCRPPLGLVRGQPCPQSAGCWPRPLCSRLVKAIRPRAQRMQLGAVPEAGVQPRVRGSPAPMSSGAGLRGQQGCRQPRRAACHQERPSVLPRTPHRSWVGQALPAAAWPPSCCPGGGWTSGPSAYLP